MSFATEHVVSLCWLLLSLAPASQPLPVLTYKGVEARVLYTRLQDVWASECKYKHCELVPTEVDQFCLVHAKPHCNGKHSRLFPKLPFCRFQLLLPSSARNGEPPFKKKPYLLSISSFHVVKILLC